MSFKEYVMGRRKTNSINGDFIEDVKRDNQFTDTDDYQTIKDYLRARNACSEAMRAFSIMYSRYKKHSSKSI